MTARHGPSWMPILTTRSSLPRSALSTSMAARIRRPATIECAEISNPLVQRGRALEVGEEERQRRDLEALIDVEIIRFEHVAEGLVGQHPLGGEERLALADQTMKSLGGDEDRRQHARTCLIFERQPQWPGTQRDGCSGRRLRLAVDQRQLLTLFGRITL